MVIVTKIDPMDMPVDTFYHLLLGFRICLGPIYLLAPLNPLLMKFSNFTM